MRNIDELTSSCIAHLQRRIHPVMTQYSNRELPDKSIYNYTLKSQGLDSELIYKLKKH